MAYSELPWRPFLGHQAWSWTTPRRGNVLYYVYKRLFYFCHVFTFLTFLKFLFERFFYIYETISYKATRISRGCSMDYGATYTILCNGYLHSSRAVEDVANWVRTKLVGHRRYDAGTSMSSLSLQPDHESACSIHCLHNAGCDSLQLQWPSRPPLSVLGNLHMHRSL